MAEATPFQNKDFFSTFFSPWISFDTYTPPVGLGWDSGAPLALGGGESRFPSGMGMTNKKGKGKDNTRFRDESDSKKGVFSAGITTRNAALGLRPICGDGYQV
jgi:hypothetical protein